MSADTKGSIKAWLVVLMIFLVGALWFSSLTSAKPASLDNWGGPAVCPEPPVLADADWPRRISNAKLRQFQREAAAEGEVQEAYDWERRARNNPNGVCLGDLFK